jgi:hypothetical protein
MLDVELYYDGSTRVRHYDGGGLVPTSATLTLRAASGAAVQTPAVTLPTLSTTATAATVLTLTLASVTGVTQGTHLAVVCDGVTYVCEVARLDGSTVYLVSALPVAVDTGSTVKTLDMVATVTAPGSAAIGDGYRLEWVYSDGTTTERQGYAAAVVRWPWRPIVSAADVRRHMADVYSDGKRSEAWCDQVAKRANDGVRSVIAAAQRRPWLYLSDASFRDAALASMRYELALMGIALGGQVYEAQRETRYALADSLSRVLTSALAYDRDQSGNVTSPSTRGLGPSVQATR